ncbi:hypothetical protein [Ekhidna sp.]
MKHSLDDIDKKKAFKVPEGYFEDLPLKIQQRISEETKPERFKIPSWSLAMAASMLVIISLIFLFPRDKNSAEILLAEIPQDELLAYLEQVEFDVYDIVSVLGDDISTLEIEETDMLDGIDMGDQTIDDVLLEYDLEDEFL